MAQSVVGFGLVPQIKGLRGGLDRRWLAVHEGNNDVRQRKRYKAIHVLRSRRGPSPLKCANQNQQQGRQTPWQEEEQRPYAEKQGDAQPSYKAPLADRPPPQAGYPPQQPAGSPPYNSGYSAYQPAGYPPYTYSQGGSPPYNQSGDPYSAYPQQPGGHPPYSQGGHPYAGYPAYPQQPGRYPPQYPPQQPYPPPPGHSNFATIGDIIDDLVEDVVDMFQD